MYIDKIVITWVTGAPDTFSDYCTTVAADTRLDPEFSFAQSEQTVEWVAKDNYSVQSVSTTLAALPESISWTSSNEEVATFNTTNGALDIVGLGQTTIKATFAGDENYKKSEATYTLTVQDSREVLTLSFEPATLTMNVGEEADLPVLNGNSGNGAVTYDSSNSDIAHVSDGVTAAQKVIAGQTEGTATITATVAETSTHKGGTATFTVTVTDPNRKGSLGNPYSVAEALENAPSTGVYVKGIVSKFTATGVYTDQYHRYSISDDGTIQSDLLLVFNGKGLNNVAFASDDDVQIGDIVVIYGNLSLYNSTKEMTTGNYIVSLKRKVDAGLAYETTTFDTFPGDDAFAAPTLTNPNQLAVTYASSNENVAVVDENTGYVVLGDVEGTATITATFAGNDDYKAGTASYTITLAKLAAGLAFEETSFEVREGADFTAPTLTNPNQLTVTYSSTNEDVAMVDENTGEVIIGEAGEATITATFAGSTKFNAQQVSYTITVIAGKLDAQLALTTEGVSMNAGTEKNITTFYTVASDGVVSYSSNATNVANVTDGKLVAVAPGTTSIIISIAESEDYQAATVELPVTVTVVADVAAFDPTAAGGFKKVTSTEGIVNGDYLIVYESGNVAFNGSLETLDKLSNTIGVTIENNLIAETDETKAAIFTIDVANGTLKSASGKYIGVSSNSNGLKQTDDAETYTHTFSIDNSGDAVISAVFDGSTMTLRYNKSSDQARFRYFKSGQQSIQLYRHESASIAVGTTGWRTLVASANVKFPAGVSAFIVTAQGETAQLTKVSAVKANVPVLVKAEPGSYSLTVVEDAECNNTDANLLQVSVQNTSEAYVLANRSQGVGFYRWTGGWMGAGRVYLPAANAARSFIGFNLGDDTTGISTTQNGNGDMTNSQYVYSLSGQRVQSPKKGSLYIVGGKKVIFK